MRPENTVTVLDTHDGIGVSDVDRGSRHPDDEPLLPRPSIDTLIDTISKKSGQGREQVEQTVRQLVGTTQS